MRVRRIVKAARDGGVAFRACLGADHGRALYKRRHKDCAIGHHARNETDGPYAEATEEQEVLGQTVTKDHITGTDSG
jgi:hypothetical protein